MHNGLVSHSKEENRIAALSANNRIMNANHVRVVLCVWMRLSSWSGRKFRFPFLSHLIWSVDWWKWLKSIVGLFFFLLKVRLIGCGVLGGVRASTLSDFLLELHAISLQLFKFHQLCSPFQCAHAIEWSAARSFNVHPLARSLHIVTTKLSLFPFCALFAF